MQMTPEGTLRPAPIDGFDVADETLLLSVCPGIHIRPRQQSDLPVNANTSTKAACPPNYAMDDIWGEYASMQYAWAACLLYTSPSPRDLSTSRMPSSA